MRHSLHARFGQWFISGMALRKGADVISRHRDDASSQSPSKVRIKGPSAGECQDGRATARTQDDDGQREGETRVSDHGILRRDQR